MHVNAIGSHSAFGRCSQDAFLAIDSAALLQPMNRLLLFGTACTAACVSQSAHHGNILASSLRWWWCGGNDSGGGRREVGDESGGDGGP